MLITLIFYELSEILSKMYKQTVEIVDLKCILSYYC